VDAPETAELLAAPSADLGDFPTPLLVLHEEAVENNVALMARYCASNGVELAPHAKTSMTPYLIDKQVDRGAWGMTAASMEQVEQLVGIGVRKVILANELVEHREVACLTRLLAEDRGPADFLCYVDSVGGVERLERQLAGRSSGATRLGVLVELGYVGGRTGARTAAAALDVARRAARSPSLDLRGFAGFEGLLPRTPGQLPARLPEFLGELGELVRRGHGAGLFADAPIVSAGGSSYFDAVVKHVGPRAFDFETTTILRSGCYVTHDHGIYHETSPLDGRAHRSSAPLLVPALELVATVLSRPEDRLAILNFGRRHVPTDDRLPVLLGRLTSTPSTRRVPRGRLFRVDDQHAYLRLPARSTIAPGDRLRFGISHPCGAFDRWRRIVVVDSSYRVVDVVPTLF
jgi:D-serine deaminase-like pyridoxal phosphate-dependent protein